ncbi:MAG: hypothetical protein CL724_05270, partial [Chloroflexi bacterium]|nr:hypothetical protein [Chloroflexota bacterium]
RIAPAIRDDFRAMLDGRRGIARAEITTAVAVDAALRSEIVTLLSSLVDQEITATFSADPQILGGMVAHVGDRLVDGSVRSKLESLRQTLGRPAAISTRDR